MTIAEATCKASHNSYERDEIPITEQLILDKKSSHQAGCRGLELDINHAPNLFLWHVGHPSVYQGYHHYEPHVNTQFREYLVHLNDWSRRNPEHEPIFLTIDVKGELDPPPGKSDRAWIQEWGYQFDRLVNSHVDPGRLWTPSDFVGPGLLYERVQRQGWPSVDGLRGRFIFVLSGDDKTKELYSLRRSPIVAFSDRTPSNADDIAGDPNRVFVNIKENGCGDWLDILRTSAADTSILSRVYGVNTEIDFQLAMVAQANIISTDKVRNHDWAKVTTRSDTRYHLWSRSSHSAAQAKAAMRRRSELCEYLTGILGG